MEMAAELIREEILRDKYCTLHTCLRIIVQKSHRMTSFNPDLSSIVLGIKSNETQFICSGDDDDDSASSSVSFPLFPCIPVYSQSTCCPTPSF